jgi:glycosyltransferase involved in cell wall biosynthesis
MSVKIKVLYISSMPLSGETGGSAVMRNHLINDRFEVFEINNAIWLEHRALSKIEMKFKNSRFHYWFNTYQHLFLRKNLNKKQYQRIREFQADVIITVAHGELFWIALKMSHQLRLPIISIFHDWWPLLFDQSNVYPVFYRNLINQRFRKLYKYSDCVLCISEGMKLELGRHLNSKILYPCTEVVNLEIFLEAKEAIKSDKPFNIYYAGNIADSYGRLLQQLIRDLPEDENLQLTILGKPHDWPEDIKLLAKQKKIVKEPLPHNEFIKELSEASAFLVTLGFEEELALLMKTNFPSKIALYAQYKKPIIIWGPSYSTGVKFMKENDAGIVVEDESVGVLIEQIRTLRNSISLQELYAQKSGDLYNQILNPIVLQNQFIQIVSEIAHDK